MSPEQDDFSELRRLLALKRHEQPPPGYFADFSQQVIIRIKNGDHADAPSRWEQLGWEAPWLRRLWSLLDTRPVLAGGLGLAVCGLFAAGILLSASDVMVGPVEPDSSGFMQFANVAPAPQVEDSPMIAFHATNGLSPRRDSLFDQIRPQAQQPNSFQPVLFPVSHSN